MSGSAFHSGGWHIEIGGVHRGPLTFEEVYAHLLAQQIDGMSPTWRKGMSAEMPLSQVPELWGALHTKGAARRPLR